MTPLGCPQLGLVPGSAVTANLEVQREGFGQTANPQSSEFSALGLVPALWSLRAPAEEQTGPAPAPLLLTQANEALTKQLMHRVIMSQNKAGEGW